MKIGEVAVISHKSENKDEFIKSICNKIDIKNDLVSFGRMDANDQLALHLYGISVDKDDNNFSWDLISRKMLGYVVIFDWDDQNSFNAMKPVIDHFSNTLQAPIVIVANVKDINQPPIPKRFFQQNGIDLSSNFRFTFGQIDKPESAKKILVLLVDMLLEKIR